MRLQRPASEVSGLSEKNSPNVFTSRPEVLGEKVEDKIPLKFSEYPRYFGQELASTALKSAGFIIVYVLRWVGTILQKLISHLGNLFCIVWVYLK